MSSDYLTDDDLELAERYAEKERQWWYEDWRQLMDENESGEVYTDDELSGFTIKRWVIRRAKGGDEE